MRNCINTYWFAKANYLDTIIGLKETLYYYIFYGKQLKTSENLNFQVMKLETKL